MTGSSSDATDAATSLTGAGFGAFFYNVIDEQGESYMLYTLSGVPRSLREVPDAAQHGVFAPTFGAGHRAQRRHHAGPALRAERAVLRHARGHLPVVSYLAVPVVSPAGEVLGGLFFGHPEAGRFTGRHERLAVGIAAHAAIALDNARLFTCGSATPRSN